VPQGILDRGERLADAGVVHNAPVFEGYVKVNPHEYAIAVEREIADRELGHWLVVL
jgi:hypothetical protein